ncbi:MAG: ABC transporter ATP-binding protein [Bacillota bacterium]|nr:ABC transporter ATP-binding protein [Bacillota bacterium]
MKNILIKIDKIRKTYNSGSTAVNALQDISLNISRGEAAAIMGPSGSGKSTLLSIIGGLNQPTEGKILIDGIDLYSLSREKRADFRREYLGFVFQQFQLIPYLNALENVMLPLTTTRYTSKQKRDMATHALHRVNMDTKSNRLPNQLSGGEQERIAIARAVVNEPPLILADEPTGSLDTKTSEEIMGLFRNLNESGLTLLMVTHNPENTAYMNRTITMQDGMLISGRKNTIATNSLPFSINESAGVTR